eukprot:61099-Rhodomonas_salina.2
MVRPCASKQNRRLCLQFAQACTKNTGNPTDLLARCGPLSPFSALHRCCPTAVRIDNEGRRDGITELECNKMLQTSGFSMIRDRRTTAKNKNDDPYGSGLYLYTEVKWRDPNNVDDLCHLLHAWNVLRAEHSHFAKDCSFETFLEVIRSMLNAWKPKDSRKDIRVRSGKRKSPCDRPDPCVSSSSGERVTMCVERQESHSSLTSTVCDTPNSPSSTRSSSCAWTHDDGPPSEDLGFQTQAKRHCPAQSFVHDIKPLMLGHQPPACVSPEWWEPEVMKSCGATQSNYWDVSLWPKLAEEEKLEDAVVLSLLQCSRTEVA